MWTVPLVSRLQALTPFGYHKYWRLNSQVVDLESFTCQIGLVLVDFIKKLICMMLMIHTDQTEKLRKVRFEIETLP